MNANLKKTKYHNIVRRKKSDKNAIRSQRPKTGLGSIPIITVTDSQKHLLVNDALVPKMSRPKAIKAFIKVHFPNECINYDIYNDWNRCSITKGELKNCMDYVLEPGTKASRKVTFGKKYLVLLTSCYTTV